MSEVIYRPFTHRGTAVDEARRLITGDRNATYGPPNQDFQRTADMANALFGHKLVDEARFTAADVAKFVILIKLSRSSHQAKADNWVDMIGYAACGYECDVMDELVDPLT